MLGVVALQVKQPQAAMELIGRSVQIAPNAGSLNNFGEALRHLNRVNEAIEAYRRSIQMQPKQLDAYTNMALAFEQIGKHDEAAAALERAADMQPQRIDLHGAAGSAWARAGDGYRAAAAFRRVLAIKPDHAAALSNLAMALANTGALDEALQAAQRGLELEPDSAVSHGSIAVVYDKLGRDAEAVAEFERAAELNPRNADYYGHRATVLERMGKLEEAVEVYQQGAQAVPNDVRLFSNLSNILRRRRRYAESVRAAERAIRIFPGYSDAHGNRALSLLALGDYTNGFVEYEWRWRCDNFTTAPREFKRPMWDGSDPAGRTILIHTEQGYGDTFQFLRYVPMLADRGAKVIVECNHSLVKLIARVRGVSRVVAAGLALPDFDLHTPLLSLPRDFGTTLETIPADVPYLSPEPQRVEAWRERLREGDFKIGLVWAGNAKPDPARTVPAALLSKLAGIPGARFYGLQKRSAPTYQPSPPELQLIDLDDELNDFHDTAAAMMNLDLILTIDTAAAHLAGALARPTWTLLPWSPDWRWMLDREDSPWYPTMRLFRQSRQDEWSDVIDRVREELIKQKGG
jgi:tetratricopeptide (TPR) repeat protein